MSGSITRGSSLDRDRLIQRHTDMYEQCHMGIKNAPSSAKVFTIDYAGPPPSSSSTTTSSYKKTKTNNNHNKNHHEPKKNNNNHTDHFVPIYISSLQLNCTHDEKLIRGTLIVQPLAMRAVQSLFEDEHGTVVNISIYSKKLDSCSSFKLKETYCHEHYPKGLKIIVLEPYYKVAMDGTLALRVDNENNILVVDTTFPSTTTTCFEIKQEANILFGRKQYSAAIETYKKAILCHEHLDLYRAILQNLALVHLKCNQPKRSIQYSTAALACCDCSGTKNKNNNNNNNEKAYYRLAMAFDALKYHDIALYCCNIVKNSTLLKKDKKFQELFISLQQKNMGNNNKPSLIDLWIDERVIEILATNIPNNQRLLLGTTTNAIQCKQLGNDYVQSNLYEQAQIQYEQALVQLLLEKKDNTTTNNNINNNNSGKIMEVVPLSKLFCNIALCYVQMGNNNKKKYHPMVVKETTIALLLEPMYEKALYQRIDSLIHMGMIHIASDIIQYTENTLFMNQQSKCCFVDSLKRRLK